MPEREILWNLGPERFFVYPVLFLALAYVIKGLYDHFRLWRIGTGPVPMDHLGERIRTVVAYAVGQHRVSFGPGEGFAGLMHGLIFTGFMTLVLVTATLAVDDWLHIMFGLHFLVGPVYLIYSLVGDLGGVALLAGLAMAFYRRSVRQPDRIAAPSPTADDGLALGLLAFLACNGFAIEGVRILLTEARAHPEWLVWSPLGYLSSLILSSIPMSDEGYRALHRGLWVTHLLTVALFLAYIPSSKFAHIFLSTANIFFRDPVRNRVAKGALVPIEDIEQQEVLGVTKLTEFTFDQLVGFDSCTNCGRCQDNCPAYLSGKPLSPRKLIQDLRFHLLTDGQAVADGGSLPADTPLLRGVIQEDTIWACVTCRACMDACPVLIEHIPAIVDLRRSLVMMEGSIPETAQSALTNMERRGHPWRGTQHLRGDWMQQVPGGVPEFTSGDDVAYLYWVGCTGALDDRAMKVTLSVVRVLKAAGVNFGVLGPQETCTGDPARRMGNEFLFQTMAAQTIEVLNSKKAKKIITNCPHCFNTFKNEYPQLGGNYEVIHHTQLIADLMKSGKLRMAPGFQGDTVSYHDPCYLGRHNGEFEAPRAVASALPGAEVVEMERNRERSFCCGAGGGHMWMEMKLGQSINRMRVEQALETGANVLATACPFCAIMFEDGVKQADAEQRIRVRDLAELVAESLDKE